MNMKKICVVGLGKLGACIAACFADDGLEVSGFDLDAKKVQSVNEGRAPVDEPGLQDLIARSVRGGRLRATTNAAEAIRGSHAAIFITPTPSLPDGSFSNKYVLEAVESVAQEVAWDEIAEMRSPSTYLFVICSTVMPRTCDEQVIPLISRLCPRKFSVAYVPQFIALGSVIENLQTPDFLLVGASSEEARIAAAELFVSLLKRNAPIKSMSLLEAELTKISVNCALTQKISFANQLAMVADAYGVSPHVILDAVGSDHRINHRLLKPGLPYAGPCLPRDNRAFQVAAHKVGVQAPLSLTADIVNDRIVDWIVGQISVHEGTVGILGTAYKPGTGITEESAGTKIAAMLPDRTVKTHDPIAPHSHSLEEVLACDVIVVATPWPDYEKVPYADGLMGKAWIDPMGVVRELTVKLKRREPEKVTE